MHFLGLYIPGVVAVFGVLLAYWIFVTAKPGEWKRALVALIVLMLFLSASVYMAIQFPSDKEHRKMMGPPPAPNPTQLKSSWVLLFYPLGLSFT